MKNALSIDYRQISDVRPNPSNARRHKKAKLKKIRQLVAQFGQITPIIIDPSGKIVDGHAVFEALKLEGHTEVATVTVTGRSESDIRALRLSLNRLAEEAYWDQPALKREFQVLIEEGYDLSLTGFNSVEIDMSLEIGPPQSGKVDDIPDLSNSDTPAVSALGDIWHLGEHCVACGNATDAMFLKNLVGENPARILVADPPFKVPVQGHESGMGATKHRKFVQASGEMSDNEFREFLSAFFGASCQCLNEGALAYVFMDWRHYPSLVQASAEAGLEILNLCVWVKTNAGLGSLYRSQHELVAVFKWGNPPHVNNVQLG